MKYFSNAKIEGIIHHLFQILRARVNSRSVLHPPRSLHRLPRCRDTLTIADYCVISWNFLNNIFLNFRIAVCGMAMKQYIKGNVSTSAANSVKYFTKVKTSKIYQLKNPAKRWYCQMLSSSSETVIFLFLGLSTVAKYDIEWDLCVLKFFFHQLIVWQSFFSVTLDFN